MGMKINLRRSPIPIHLIKVLLGTSLSTTGHLVSSFRPTVFHNPTKYNPL